MVYKISDWRETFCLLISRPPTYGHNLFYHFGQSKSTGFYFIVRFVFYWWVTREECRSKRSQFSGRGIKNCDSKSGITFYIAPWSNWKDIKQARKAKICEKIYMMTSQTFTLFLYKQPEKDLSLNFSQFLCTKLLKMPLILVSLTRK